MAISAGDMIGEAIDALVRADAERLEYWAQQAPGIASRMTEEERRAAIRQHCVLGKLIERTRRNLRLLGCAMAGPDGYGPRCG
jgi:hypothetical protein